MPALSVVIPTYNRATLVVEAVESVLAQQGVQPEVVVVDDGSTDATRAALDRFAGRIIYVHQRNAGVNAARNAGIRASSGEYVAFLDCDDAWLPFKAALQLAVMERVPDAGFAFSNFFVWREGERTPDGLGHWMAPGESIARHARLTRTSAELGIPSPRPFAVHVCDIYRLSLRQPVVLPSTSVVRRSVLAALGPLPEDNWMCGDWEYFARASRQFGAAYVEIETALNRSHDDAVRLMRRPLADRTRQRIASIRRTWRADADFMARFAAEVDRVEAAEWKTLFKQTCYEGDLAEAREQLREIERLSGSAGMASRALWWAMRVPAARSCMAALRRNTR
ncbi:MAG: glycosyltransferase family 2 protein [Betaproteobacteria bacterium]|jgi:glycosyltransferase involved in cell wall biosynthesis|nr:glycosyltransferase family 2 protein [Betaproteobacteria bacterium]